MHKQGLFNLLHEEEGTDDASTALESFDSDLWALIIGCLYSMYAYKQLDRPLLCTGM